MWEKGLKEELKVSREGAGKKSDRERAEKKKTGRKQWTQGQRDESGSEQEGGKIKGNLSEISDIIPFAITAFIVKFYEFNT